MYSLGLFLIIVFVPVIVIPKNILIKETPYKAVLEAFIASSVAILLLFIVATVTGGSLGEHLAKMVEEMIPALVANPGFIANPIFADMTSGEVQIQLAIVYTTMINRLPGYLLIGASLTSYLEYTLIAKLMSGRIGEVRKLPAFHTFSWPKSGVWGWLIIFGGSWVLSQSFDFGALALANVQILMEYYFFVQGAAVLFFFSKRKRWPKFIPPLLLIGFAITPISRSIIFILGLADLILDLRSRMDNVR